jgi:DnaJ-class molecular chaperone
MEETAQTSRLRLSPENCATCNGQGIGPNQQTCACCQGKGRILVGQPSKRCPRCGGSGKPEAGNCWCVEYCVICHGTGWIWTEFHLALDDSTIRRAMTTGR